MFDRRFPELRRVENAPYEGRARRLIIESARELAARTGCRVVWHDLRGGLFCYLSTPDSGVHFVKMRRPDGKIELDRPALDTAVLYIQCSRQPKKVKQAWKRHHDRNEKAEKEAAQVAQKAEVEKDVLKQAEFLDRRRRGVQTEFLSVSV